MTPTSTLTLRTARPDDAEACGRICFEAFRHIAERHAFPPDFPEPAAAIGALSLLLGRPGVHGVVAERDGRVVGSNFLWEATAIAGIGPITIDPAAQDGRVGRALMEHVLARADERGALSVRLVQAAYHNRSLSLYTKLGFAVREPLSVLQGPPPRVRLAGHDVRAVEPDDLPDCNALCRRVHGHDRAPELADALTAGGALLVERHGRITGYATPFGFFGHAVGESDADLAALIGAAPAFTGPGMLLPTRNGELLRWCLGHGLRVVQPMSLMSRGLYAEPRGAFLPSIIY